MCNVYLSQNITQIAVYGYAAEERPWVWGGSWEARAKQCRESFPGGKVPPGGAAKRSDGKSEHRISTVLW